MAQYIWDLAGWPSFTWRSEDLIRVLGSARQAQGRLLGQADFVGMHAQAEVLIEEALTTSAIEGEELNRESVRSSVARRLGLPTAGLPMTQRPVDGLVEMLNDATGSHAEPLTSSRLFGWHAALFPTGYSGMKQIAIADWRSDREPMQVVSGPIGKERVHYEAPPFDRVAGEMNRFLKWWGAGVADVDGLLRAGVAHFWFVTIHPFEDGNGRIARAITDMALARDERTGRRLYSMSAQINAERDDYYRALEHSQKGGLDITDWLFWFLGCLRRAMQRSEVQILRALDKGRFWQNHAHVNMNERQREVVNRMLDAGPDGFEGGLTNRKYVSMTRTSRETAKRDIADLCDQGVLQRNPGGGRSASYDLIWP